MDDDDEGDSGRGGDEGDDDDGGQTTAAVRWITTMRPSTHCRSSWAPSLPAEQVSVGGWWW